MKAHLLHGDRDFEWDREPPPQAEALRQDLGLDDLLYAMARRDEFLLEVASRVVLAALDEPEEISYRQEVLRDCLEHPDLVRELYGVAVEAIEKERRAFYGFFSHSPGMILYRASEVLGKLLDSLKELRRFSDRFAGEFRSEGLSRFFSMIGSELDDDYLELVENHLKELRFRHGVLISARLGRGGKGSDYVLRRPHGAQRGLKGIFTSLANRRSGYVYQLPPRDEAGGRALNELRDRGINLVANAAGQSADHIVSFFQMLRRELGFFVACLNLHEQLEEQGGPSCFPEPVPRSEPALCTRGLYDVGLALRTSEKVIGNELDTGARKLVMITGANQGGKSTFLRSIGLAQLMMQCGMFVGAESFRADVRDGVFTHFKREEDAEMESGKLDEELRRMSEIADSLTPGALVLCNESFAATNEQEGSQIGREIVQALIDAGVRVMFVTHMYELAHGFYETDGEAVVFLRAERRPDGTRTFRLVEGEPLPTSFGVDVYNRVFGGKPEAVSAGPPAG